MKNKLLLSLLCATAISSTGFAASPEDRIAALEEKVEEIRNLDAIKGMLAKARSKAAQTAAAALLSPPGSAASSKASSKASSGTSTPLAALSEITVNGKKRYLDEKTNKIFKDVTGKTESKSIWDATTGRAKHWDGEFNIDGSKWVDPATAQPLTASERAWAKAKSQRGAVNAHARLILQTKLNDKYAKLEKDRNKLDLERSQLETQLLDLDNQFKANSPAYGAAKQRLADAKQRLDVEDSRLDQEAQRLADEKVRVDAYEAEYNQQVAEAEAILTSTKPRDKKAVTEAINSLPPKSDGRLYDVVADKDAIVEALVQSFIKGEADLESYAKYRADEDAFKFAKASRNTLFDEANTAEQAMDPFKQSKSKYKSDRKPLEERLAQIPDELKPLDDGIAKIETIKSARTSLIDNLKKPAPGGAGSAAASGGANNPPPPPPPPAPKKPEISVPNLAGGVSVVADDLSSAPNTPVNNSSSSPVAVSGTGGQGGSGASQHVTNVPSETVSGVEYTTSDGKKVHLTDVKIAAIKSHLKSVIGTGRGSSARHAEVDAKTAESLALNFTLEEINNIK